MLWPLRVSCRAFLGRGNPLRSPSFTITLRSLRLIGDPIANAFASGKGISRSFRWTY
jgi:hypothetical protein